LATVLSAQIGLASRRGWMGRGTRSIQTAPQLAGYITLVCGVAGVAFLWSVRPVWGADLTSLAALIRLGTLARGLNVRIGIGTAASASGWPSPPTSRPPTGPAVGLGR
jgi:hypothetical protein